ncbi:hypothetical protein ACSQ67_025838 [Phaseolus vulgaris]
MLKKPLYTVILEKEEHATTLSRSKLRRWNRSKLCHWRRNKWRWWFRRWWHWRNWAGRSRRQCERRYRHRCSGGFLRPIYATWLELDRSIELHVILKYKCWVQRVCLNCLSLEQWWCRVDKITPPAFVWARRSFTIYGFGHAGLILWEMVTGTIPYEDMTPIQDPFAVVNKVCSFVVKSYGSVMQISQSTNTCNIILHCQ